MSEEEIWGAFEEAAPYISNLWWLRNKLRELLREGLSGERLKQRLLAEADDITKRSDVRILFLYLERKKGGGRGS